MAITEPAPFLYRHEAQIVSLGFSCNQNIHGLCHLYVRLCQGCKDRGRICFAFIFACVIIKKLKTPIADDAITWGGAALQGLGFPLYICGYNPCKAQLY